MTARRLTWGSCPTQKIRYRNRKAARSAIDTHRNRWRAHTPQGTPFPELWVYRCPRCRGWHFTHIRQEVVA